MWRALGRPEYFAAARTISQSLYHSRIVLPLSLLRIAQDAFRDARPRAGGVPRRLWHHGRAVRDSRAVADAQIGAGSPCPGGRAILAASLQSGLFPGAGGDRSGGPRSVLVCRNCRRYLERHPALVREKGRTAADRRGQARMRLSFHGADRDVTGSCHLLEVAEKKILIDCGLLQGSRELNEENAGAFGFEAGSIDFVLLTHAHLDHCGRLPLLAKRGFKGEIISTAATAELANLVLMDAAHMQGEEKPHRGPHTEQEQVPPLYTPDDAQNAVRRFGRKADYGNSFNVTPGIRAR